MLERRRHVRARDFVAGTLAYGAAAPHRRATVDCVVRDASEGGAMLLLDEPCRAPVEMELATRDGTRRARVVWRGETAVGVRFLGASASASSAPVVASTIIASAGVVVDLDAARRRRMPGSDASRLAERIARFVRPSRRPDTA